MQGPETVGSNAGLQKTWGPPEELQQLSYEELLTEPHEIILPDALRGKPSRWALNHELRWGHRMGCCCSKFVSLNLLSSD